VNVPLTETRIPTEAEASNLEVLGTTVAALGTESSTLSFGWAMVDWGFTTRADGFYYIHTSRSPLSYRGLWTVIVCRLH
jgi:hypothetical protein